MKTFFCFKYELFFFFFINFKYIIYLRFVIKLVIDEYRCRNNCDIVKNCLIAGYYDVITKLLKLLLPNWSLGNIVQSFILIRIINFFVINIYLSNLVSSDYNVNHF